MAILPSKLLPWPSVSHGSAMSETWSQYSEDDPDNEKPLRNLHSVSSKRIFSSNTTWTSDYNVPDTRLEDENPILSWFSIPCRVGSGSFYSGRVHAVSGHVPIRYVLIYTGHANKLQFAPYASSVTRVQEMFKELNKYRENKRLDNWKIIPLQGKEFMEALTIFDSLSTLLVFPAGESTNLDHSFDSQEKNEIQNFLYRGGRGYFTCGSAFWILKKRTWYASCTSYPNAGCSNPIKKTSELPLVDGEAVGPLCPLPNGMMHGAGFYSIAITVKYGNKKCTVFLGGGGSVILKDRLSDLKLAILSQLSKPSEPPGKRVKKVAVAHTARRSSFALLDRLSSVMNKETPGPFTSSLPRKAESLTDMQRAFETTNNSPSISETNTFRKVESMIELNNLERSFTSSSAQESPSQKTRVFARYDHEELMQLGINLGKTPDEMKKLENAVVLARTGRGAVLASMLHPYYKAEEIDPERYEREFQNSGTNWRVMMDRLSPLATRVDFFFNMMESLETFNFNES